MKKNKCSIDYVYKKDLDIPRDLVDLVKDCSNAKEAYIRLRDAIKAEGTKVTVYTTFSQTTPYKDLLDYDIASSSLCHILSKNKDVQRITVHESNRFRNTYYIIISDQDQNLNVEICDNLAYSELIDAIDKGDALKYFANDFFDKKTKLFEWA